MVEKSSTEILDAAAKAQDDRAKSRDTPEGERSMRRCVAAFNALEGTNLTEAQGWRFMAVLKAARATAGQFSLDDYVDGASYFALAGEAAQPRHIGIDFAAAPAEELAECRSAFRDAAERGRTGLSDQRVSQALSYFGELVTGTLRHFSDIDRKQALRDIQYAILHAPHDRFDRGQARAFLDHLTGKNPRWSGGYESDHINAIEAAIKAQRKK